MNPQSRFSSLCALFLFAACNASGNGAEDGAIQDAASLVDVVHIDAPRVDASRNDAAADAASEAQVEAGADAAVEVDASVADATNDVAEDASIEIDATADADAIDAATFDAAPDAEALDAEVDMYVPDVYVPTLHTCEASLDTLEGVPFACDGVPECDADCADVATDECTYTCTPWGACTYECPAPSCTCAGGTTHTDVTCDVDYTGTCDPVCEPPRCNIECDEDQCVDQSCPMCSVVCGSAHCAWRCREPEIDSCSEVFGCVPTPPVTCMTTCREIDCTWLETEESYPSTPTCLGGGPGTGYRVVDDGVGHDCSDGGTASEWGIRCEAPECEIRCESGAPHTPPSTCDSSAHCDVDCVNPTCTVTCDTPSCAEDEDGGYACPPPTNCVTSCTCTVGECDRLF